MRRLLRAFRNLFRRAQVEDDLTSELDSWQALLADEKTAQGYTITGAHRAARLESGGREWTAEAVRDARAGAWLEQLGRDVRYAMRTLRRSPGFTTFTLLTFAVAIAGLTVIFSLENAALLKPLPYPDPDRLVMVLESPVTDPDNGGLFSAPNYQDVARQADVFQHLALYEYLGFNLGDKGEPLGVAGLRATGQLFDVLGVPPMLGRGLVPSDDSGAGGKVVVLSYGLWQRRYGSDSAIVGRTIPIDGEPFQVVGVMPRGFAFAGSGQQLWVPIQLNAEDAGRGSHSFFAIGRLKSDVSVAQAKGEMRIIGGRLAAEYPASNTGQTVTAFPMSDLWVGNIESTLRMLLIAVGLVLLIASANIASLVVARNAARRREIASRLALGGSRGRILRQLVTESALLGLGGAALGLVLASFGLRAVLTLPIGLRNLPFRDLDTVSLDWKVCAVAAIAALGAGILAGLVPALTLVPGEPAEMLRDDGARSGASRRSGRLKGVLVGIEVALAVVVLVGAGLLVTSMRRIERVPPGLNVHNLLSVAVSVPQPDFYGPASRRSFCADVAREVGSIPGIVAVGAVSHLPLSGSSAGRDFMIEGAPDPGSGNTPGSSYGTACPGYFHAAGIPLLAGRDFSDADRADAPGVVIINDQLRKRWFRNQNPIGRRFKLGGYASTNPWLTIIGVAGDVRHNGLYAAPDPYFWATYQQAAWPRMEVTVRTSGAPEASTPAIRAALRRAVPADPSYEGTSMEHVLEDSLSPLRFPMVLFSVFAAAAVLLAALGCFGVANQAVVQRRRELAVRVALGARAGQIYRLVISQAMTPVGWGLIAGLLAALVGTRLLRQLLFDITPTDPATLALGALVLAGVTVAACMLPAGRAARVDPANVLREE